MAAQILDSAYPFGYTLISARLWMLCERYALGALILRLARFRGLLFKAEVMEALSHKVQAWKRESIRRG